MSGINKVFISGRLGKDPEARFTQSGTAVTNFSVATSEKYKPKDGGEAVEKTEWHKCVTFGSLAEIASSYLTKGCLVSIVGKLQTRKWQDQAGNDKYSTEIVVDELMLPPKGDGEAKPHQTANEKAGGFREKKEPKQQELAGATDPDFDDDIPF